MFRVLPKENWFGSGSVLLGSVPFGLGSLITLVTNYNTGISHFHNPINLQTDQLKVLTG
jgi:hypothetical protein